MDFTHFDENGNAIMVDVSSKDTLKEVLLLMVKYMLVKKYLRKLKIIK